MNITVVVDPAYGEHLAELSLSKNVPVWVVATPINEEAFRRILEQRTLSQRRSIIDHRSPGSITSFKIYSDAENRRGNLLDVIPVIDSTTATGRLLRLCLMTPTTRTST